MSAEGFSGRLIESEFLSRDEALERYFTPLPKSQQDTSVKLLPNRIVDLGNGVGSTLVYRPTAPFMNHQIREQYSVDYISSMASDLEQYTQLEECGAAAFRSEEALESYINDSNDFYQTETAPEDIPRLTRMGLWTVAMYGHNRQLAAAASNLRNNGHPDRGIMLRAHVHYDPTFLDFLHMQAVENTGQKPPAWNRARSMSRMLELGLRDGLNYSFKDIADCYGVDQDQVWRAYNYVQLPAGVQKLVEDDKLPYSGAVELRRLLDVYAEQDVHQLALDAARSNWSAKQVAGEVAKRINVRSLPAEFQSLVEGEAIKPKHAELVLDMHLAGASGAELREFIMWISDKVNPPRIDEVRERVAKRRGISRDGQQDIFSGGLDPDDAAIQRDKVAVTSQRLLIGKTIEKLAGTIATLRKQLECGAFVDLASQHPIREAVGKVNGQLMKGVDGLLYQGGLSEVDNYLKAASELLDANTVSPKTRDDLYSIVVQIAELLDMEEGTDTRDQVERVNSARERIVQVTGSYQGSIF